MKKKAWAISIILLWGMLSPLFFVQADENNHLPCPEKVKGLYITYWIARTPRLFNPVVDLAQSSKLNTLVIDVDYSGKNVLFPDDKKTEEMTRSLHQKGFYLIARVVAFKNNTAWFDPASKERWNDLVKISRRAFELGFDEINFDYVRFGSVNEPKSSTPIKERTGIVTSFFSFLSKELSDKGVPISLDIFGSTFMMPESNIGQDLSEAVKYFDYVMPMPYPSHWARGSFGIDSPGRNPYQSVFTPLYVGWKKVKDQTDRKSNLRTWIQAFGLESSHPIKYYPYGPREIEHQVDACYQAGCQGWILWNADNKYKKYLEGFKDPEKIE